jgi:SSS family transporter
MILLGLFGYVLAQFAVGVWVSRRMASDTDYILAGRSLGPVLVAFSVFATWFGAEAIVATSGEVYEKGLGGAAVDPFAYAAALILSGLVVAGALWRRGLTTFADLFRQRFSRQVEALVVLILLPGSIFWAAAQIRAFGSVLAVSSGANLTTMILLAAVLVAAYSAVGGLLADAVTDFVQGTVVIIGLIVLALAVASLAGGAEAVLAETAPERLSLFGGSDESPWKRAEQIVVALGGSLVAVELISRFLGARSAEVARIGTIAGGLMYLAIGFIPIFLGLAAALLVQTRPALKEALAQPEQLVPALAQLALPQWGYVLFSGALVSAILSTVHAALHAPASQVSHNIIARLRPEMEPAARLRSVRLTVLALSVVALVLALTSERIKDLVEVASAFGSAGVFVAAAFGVFTSFGGARSAMASVVTGGVVWAVGRFALDWTAPYITALVASALVYAVVAQAEQHAAGR